MFGALNMTGSPNILSSLIFFLFFFPSRNRQRKLGTKVQWSTKFICETEFRTTRAHRYIPIYRRKQMFTQPPPNQKMAKKVNTKTTLENHHLDWRGCKGVKGKKKTKHTKKYLQVAGVPGPGPEPTAWASPSPRLSSLYSLPKNALQCMQDCVRGILFNDRLIYIF